MNARNLVSNTREEDLQGNSIRYEEKKFIFSELDIVIFIRSYTSHIVPNLTPLCPNFSLN